MKYSLKTLPKKMSSKESCLNHLGAILDEFSGRVLVRELAYIGKILSQANSFEEGDAELIAKYASEPMKMDLKVDAASNRNVLLFNRFALKLIDELLRITFPKTSVSPLYEATTNSYVCCKGILVRAREVDSPLLPIQGIFQLANTLITIIQEEPSCFTDESSEQARFFYGRLGVDKSVAIGRSRMYRYGDFPLRLKQVDIDIEEYLQAIFSLCAYVESLPFVELEFPASLKQMNANSQKVLLKYLPRLSSNAQGQAWNLAASDALLKLYYTDFLCRQHPLIQTDSRYYCLEPDLLWASLADLPFYLLLDSCNRDQKKVDALGTAWGDIFEENWRNLGERVFGADKCEDYLCQKGYPKMKLGVGHRIGDLFVTLNANIRIIWEFKGVSPDDLIKLGNRSRARSKFIQQVNKDKGIPQLVRDSSVYRQETSFNGVIFTVFVCRGPIPLTSDFDTDVKNYLQDLRSYQDYLVNPQNRAVIWLDALSAELLFSGLRQGLDAEDALQSLAGIPPSQIPRIISERIQQQGLQLSRARLYTEEIEFQAQLCRSMFCEPSEMFT
jgi:hypothetical protein